MTERTFRELTIDDMDQIATVVNSRDRFAGAIEFDKQTYINSFQRQFELNIPMSLGCFIDGHLDCFMMWRYVSDTPRAYDPSLTDPLGSISFSSWSMKRPDREKLPSGHDVGQSMLSVEQLKLFRQIKIYTTWSILPAEWRSATTSTYHEEEMQYWHREILATINPGEIPTGPGAEWIMRATNRNPSTFPMQMLCRAISVKDEFRE